MSSKARCWLSVTGAIFCNNYFSGWCRKGLHPNEMVLPPYAPNVMRLLFTDGTEKLEQLAGCEEKLNASLQLWFIPPEVVIGTDRLLGSYFAEAFFFEGIRPTAFQDAGDYASRGELTAVDFEYESVKLVSRQQVARVVGCETTPDRGAAERRAAT